MLTKKQLKDLRKDIVLNSLNLKDYSNDLYIKEKTVCDFFNGYIDYLYELATETHFKSKDLYDVLDGLYMKNTKLKKYKLYESSRNGYYFKINNQRYYINDFIKVNY